MSYPQKQQHRPAKPPVPRVDFPQYLAALEPDFKAALTEQRMTWAKEFEYAKQAIAKNKTLAETAAGNLDSLRAAIINVAAVGISLNPIAKQAYLVPRGGAVCLDISYQGLIDLAVDAGAILWAEAKLVYEQDVYENLRTEKPPHHEYDAFGDRGEIVGAYSLAKRHDGTYHVLEMTITELEQIRDASGAKSGESPWQKWFEQMCLKAVVKRASKWWAKAGDRFHTAVQMLNDQEGNAEPIENAAWGRPIEREPQTESETLNLLLEHDDSPMVDGQTIEEWILNAETREDFARTRQMLRDMAPSPTKVRLQTLWMYTRDEMAKFHNARPETATSDETTS